MGESGSGFSSETVEELRSVQKARTLFKAAGISLQLWEAYGLDRSLRGLLRREVDRFFDPSQGGRPPELHSDLLERLRLIREQAGPIVRKLRQFLPEARGAAGESESQEIALALLISNAQGREMAMRWLSDPARYHVEAAGELQRIGGIAEMNLGGIATAPPPPPETAAQGPPPVAPVARPAAPEELTAEPGNGSVSLAWKGAKEGTTFIVKRATSPGGPYVNCAANLVDTAYSDLTVKNGLKYYFVVAAVNAAGEGPPSRECETLPLAPPPAPGGLSAVPGNGRVWLSWFPLMDPATYHVKRSATPGGPYTRIAQGSDTEHVDTAVKNGEMYEYVVSASNSRHEGPDSTAVQARPVDCPGALSPPVAAPGDAHVTLSWTPSPAASSYNVKRATAPQGPFATLATQVPQPTYEDTTTVNGTTYYYAISAVNAGGESPDSAPTRAAPEAPPPAPTGLEAALGNQGVTLRWNPARGASGYHLKRAAQQGGPYATIARNVAQTTYQDTHVTRGTTYYYVVSAVSAGGEGPNSSELSQLVVAPPTAPLGLVALPGNGRVSIRWDSSPGAARYNIKRSAPQGGPYATLASPSSPIYGDRAVTNGTTYTYVVTAVNAGGESPPSGPASATPLSPPEAPQRLSAAPGNGRTALSWTASKGATGYHVRRSTHRGGPFATIARVAAETEYTDSAVTNGTLYDYVVTAVNVGGESPPSNVARAMPLDPPEAPQGLELSPGNGRVLLLWAAAKGATSYQVKRATAPGGPFVVIGGASETTYTDATVQSGTTYFYRVSGVNAGGESPDTAEAWATPVEPPLPPSGLRAVPENGRVSLSWSPSTGATGYNVRRSTSTEGPFTTIASPTEPTHIDRGAENETTYYYFVTAVNAAGRSPGSARVSAKPSAATAGPGIEATWGTAGDGPQETGRP